MSKHCTSKAQYVDIKDRIDSVDEFKIVKNLVKHSLESLKQKRKLLDDEWDEKYENFSTWEHLTFESPDYSDLDALIQKLEIYNKSLEIESNSNKLETKEFYKSRKRVALERLNEAFNKSKELSETGSDNSSLNPLVYGMWSSIFDLPSSVTISFYETHHIYDCLRKVNSNFSELSDSEIFFETLWMSKESLTGLANLTKGAYFEMLVAENTGGILFEHFNHKDTDIIIDGEEIQLKATDSISYINSVDDDITIIATSEVAEKTGVIDSGISNQELTEMTNSALGLEGGFDLALSSLDGLGTFATLRGITHACEKFNNGESADLAIEEGIGIAVSGSIKAACDTFDLGKKIVTSDTTKAVGKKAYNAGEVVYNVTTSSTSKTIFKAIVKFVKILFRILSKTISIFGRLLSK